MRQDEVTEDVDLEVTALQTSLIGYLRNTNLCGFDAPSDTHYLWLASNCYKTTFTIFLHLRIKKKTWEPKGRADVVFEEVIQNCYGFLGFFLKSPRLANFCFLHWRAWKPNVWLCSARPGSYGRSGRQRFLSSCPCCLIGILWSPTWMLLCICRSGQWAFSPSM